MIAEKILNAILEIDAMAHEFTPEQWNKIKLIKKELKDAQLSVHEIETRMPIDTTSYQENCSKEIYCSKEILGGVN